MMGQVFMNTHTVLTELAIGVSDLKKNPMAAMTEAQGQAIAVLNRNKPVFYAVPAALYEKMIDELEDIELARIAEERKDDETIEVNIDDL